MQKIKPIIPPILLDKIIDLKNQNNFRNYKYLVAKNKKLKNIHLGERCFILGSGPSIKKQDLKPLKGEIIFALNNFYVHPDFQTITSGNKPKYYMTAPIHPPQTENEWKEWFEEMENHIPKEVTMLLGLSGYSNNIKNIFDKYRLFQDHTIYWYFAGMETKKNPVVLNGLDLTERIWSAGSVSVYAIISALYMGFDKIYLLGMDHDYFLYDDEKDMRMYKSAIHQKDELRRTFGNSFYVEEFLRQYHIFRQYEILNIEFPNRIYNASAGGILKIFEKIQLETVIGDSA